MRSPSGSTRNGDHAIEQGKEQIDQRQQHSEQRGDAHQLCQELPGLRRENAHGQQAPQSAVA